MRTSPVQLSYLTQVVVSSELPLGLSSTSRFLGGEELPTTGYGVFSQGCKHSRNLEQERGKKMSESRIRIRIEKKVTLVFSMLRLFQDIC